MDARLVEIERALTRATKPDLVNACMYFGLLKSGNKPDLKYRLTLHLKTSSLDAEDLEMAFTADFRFPSSPGVIRVPAPQPPIRVPSTTPATSGPVVFEATSIYTGPRAGYVYKNGDRGSGYYLEERKASPILPVTAPAKQAPAHQPQAPSVSPATQAALCNLDVFHPKAALPESEIFLFPIKRVSIGECFQFRLPNVGDWRRQGLSLWFRGVRETKDKSPSHCWPRSLSIRINDMLALDIQAPKPLKARRDDPANVSQYFRIGVNSIRVDVREIFYDQADYSIGLILCREVAVREICARVPREPALACHNRILNILQRPTDIEVVSESSRSVELKCPLSQFRLKTPVRTRNCEHLSWFDLEAFIEINKITANINQRWKCPKCQKQAMPTDLVIDSLAEEILRGTESDEVQFTPEGAWNEKTPEIKQQDARESYESDEPPEEDDAGKSRENVIDLENDGCSQAPAAKKQRPTPNDIIVLE